jgi:hypothetical protein
MSDVRRHMILTPSDRIHRIRIVKETRREKLSVPTVRRRAALYEIDPLILSVYKSQSRVRVLLPGANCRRF